MKTNYYVCKEEEQYEDLDEERKKILIEWIKANFIPIKTINYRCGTSYRLKHIIQYQHKMNCKYYFTNEQFKRAMLICGFKVGNPQSRKWYFNISQRSEALLWERSR